MATGFYGMDFRFSASNQDNEPLNPCKELLILMMINGKI
jgi:hypothetical protein